MTEKKYHVVFSGDVAQGEAIPNVKERMAALFKTSAASIESLFNKKIAVIKKDVDQETAQKYVQLIRRTGAICRIVPAEARSTPAPQPQKAQAPLAQPPEPERRPEQSGPRVVAIQLIHKADLGFAPHIIKKLSKSGDGINFNKMDVPETGFNNLIAMAAYSEIEDGKEKSKLLLFSNVSKRPFVCNAEHIDYTSFSIDGTKSAIASFRNFLFFLCRQNPSVFVEESTFDFLSGSSMQKLNQNTILKLTTNMGKLIETGEMAAQT